MGKIASSPLGIRDGLGGWTKSVLRLYKGHSKAAGGPRGHRPIQDSDRGVGGTRKRRHPEG